MTRLERLRDKANSLPQTPGVYIMKAEDGTVLYVGKSKALKNRVGSYFTGSGHTAKTARLVSLVHDFDYILCDTEIEALTLENVLIKKHTPKYNIKLKDAKSYPYIKVSGGEYPTLSVTRERRADRAHYYGPYAGTAQAYTALDTVRRIFSLPTCKRRFPADIGKERPCIYLDMGRCLGICRGTVTPEDYRAAVRMAEGVLDGHIRPTVKALQAEMEAAAEALEFERAASLRDSIRSLEKLLEKQKVVADAKVHRDVFAFYSSATEGVLSMLSVRGGAVVHKNEFILSSARLADAEDAMQLIADFYDTQSAIPPQVMLDFPLSDEDLSLLSDYLSLLAGHRVHVRVPERGDGRRLCDLALENAAEAARQHRLENEREDKHVARLCELLGLSERPSRIECYDISNIGREAMVGAMIVYEGGRYKKSDYRLFSVKSTNGPDDYASMKEVLTRRLSHVGDGSASLGTAPDLILLDGGDAHVHVGKAVLESLALDIPLFGMVKDDYHKTRAITDGEREISIAQETSVYTFVYKMQEEVHRFAITSSQNNKRKSLKTSTLERIPGIGPAKARRLLAAMPLGELRRADEDALRAIGGISDADARAVYAYFHKDKGTKKS